MRTLGLVGVPTSAGAHWFGQEKAPSHLRRAGLTERLGDTGCHIVDYGDLPLALFRTDPQHRHEQNQDKVVEVAESVADRVEQIAGEGRLPFVIGGDCTITVGAIAGMLRRTSEFGLLYLDGGADLNTPANSPTGIFDSMGLAHMLGMASGPLSAIGPRRPLLSAQSVAAIGFQLADFNRWERSAFELLECFKCSRDECLGRAADAAARDAVSALRKYADGFWLHFDVDVIDYVDLPIADVPSFTGGLPWLDTVECLRTIAGSEGLVGVTVTEFNPDRDPDLSLARSFIDGLASVFRVP